uniref:c-type cytochrome n=1 Tax=Sphingomonas sp. PL-96 TaxID=2887201 RepID=UPI001E63B931|nr:c-type cytochrome [Sphingomonas sp. PL-96]
MTRSAGTQEPQERPQDFGTAIPDAGGVVVHKSARCSLSVRMAAALALTAALAACGSGGSDPRRTEARSRAPLAERLASADASKGKRLFRECAACHTVARGGGDRNGPNLHGVVGRPIASGSRRFGYTAGLEAVGGHWSPDRLDAWITNPQRFAPGTSMAYPGMANGVDRADLIAYLAQQK